MTFESRADARAGAAAVDLASEAWLIRRLGDHGRRIEDGATDCAIRRERIRTAILEGALEGVVAGRGTDGKSETYAQVFARLYREPLGLPVQRGDTR